jgi:hypothetical protein
MPPRAQRPFHTGLRPSANARGPLLRVFACIDLAVDPVGELQAQIAAHAHRREDVFLAGHDRQRCIVSDRFGQCARTRAHTASALSST